MHRGEKETTRWLGYCTMQIEYLKDRKAAVDWKKGFEGIFSQNVSWPCRRHNRKELQKGFGVALLL